MKNNRDELTHASQKLKDSIEKQMEEFKGKIGRYGKIALWAGGGALAVYLLSRAIGGNDDEEQEQTDGDQTPARIKRVKQKQKLPNTQGESKPNFLVEQLKEQAILFTLGLAASQLKTFLDNIEDKDEQEGAQ